MKNFDELGLKELDEEKIKLNRLNTALTLVEEELVVEELQLMKKNVETKINKLKSKNKEIQELQHTFFSKLYEIGKLKSIKLPEPSEIDLIEVEADFLEKLIKFLNKSGKKAFDYEKLLNFDDIFIKFFKFKQLPNFKIANKNFLKEYDYSNLICKEFINEKEKTKFKFKNRLQEIASPKFNNINFLNPIEYKKIIFKEFGNETIS